MQFALCRYNGLNCSDGSLLESIPKVFRVGLRTLCGPIKFCHISVETLCFGGQSWWKRPSPMCKKSWEHKIVPNLSVCWRFQSSFDWNTVESWWILLPKEPPTPEKLVLFMQRTCLHWSPGTTCFTFGLGWSCLAMKTIPRSSGCTETTQGSEIGSYWLCR